MLCLSDNWCSFVWFKYIPLKTNTVHALVDTGHSIACAVYIQFLKRPYIDQTDKKTEVILGLKLFLTVLYNIVTVILNLLNKHFVVRIILILPFPKMYGGISCCINSKLLMQNNGKPQPNSDKATTD